MLETKKTNKNNPKDYRFIAKARYSVVISLKTKKL